jgi:hypothetical protein
MRGEPEKNVIIRRPAEANLQRLLREEMLPLKEGLSRLREVIPGMAENLNTQCET